VLVVGFTLSPHASNAQPSSKVHVNTHHNSQINVMSLKMSGTASTGSKSVSHSVSTAHIAAKGSKSHVQYAKWGGGISCVPFARQASGIELKGNAANWWDEADGIYARGSTPELGSVLNFRANSSMRLGHVAVVSAVINSREIEIDHANWAGPGAGNGGISRNMSVIDVSPDNDWTAVRVGLGHTGQYGSIYPTYGFIYDHKDTGNTEPTFAASVIPAPVLNAPPRDLRPISQRTAVETQVSQNIDFSLADPADAPFRNIR